MITDLPLEKALPYIHEIKDLCDQHSFNCDLVLAMIFQESGGKICSYRVEKAISLTYMPSVISRKLGITHDTETLFQNTSWGLMQIMGFKARELGYDDDLPKLCHTSYSGLLWGIKALASTRAMFPYEEDYIAAYNGGAGAVLKKNANGYTNQKYVDEVKEKWAFIEKKGLVW